MASAPACEGSTVVLLSDGEMPDGMTVSRKAESSNSQRPASQERASVASPSLRPASTQAEIIGDIPITGASSKIDQQPETSYGHDTRQQSQGTSLPPAKRMRLNDTVPATNSTTTEAGSSKMIEPASESQGSAVVNLVFPERPQKPNIEASQHSGSHALTSASPSNNVSLPWNPQHVHSKTVDELQKSLQASLRAASSQHQRAEEITGSDTESLGPYINADGSVRRRRPFSHRTKTGCLTCRERKKKCDEAKPVCGNCIKGKYQCQGYGTKPTGGTHVELRRVGPGQMPYTTDQSGPRGRSLPSMPEQRWSGPYVGYFGHGTAGQQSPPFFHDPHASWRPPPYPPDPGQFRLRHVRPTMVDRGSVSMHDSPQIERWPPPESRAICSPSIDHPRSERYQRHGGESMRTPIAGRTLSPTQMSYMPDHADGDREEMLIGKAFRPWKSTTLMCDRRDCREAVDLYNRGAMPRELMSQNERANRFGAILNPSKRQRQSGTAHSIGRIGRCGGRTIVDAPFHCDYGYNLVIGSDTVIFPNCYIQDPCEILIGNRVIIGPNCRLYGMTAHIDHRRRGGSQGEFRGGTIQIMDGAWIGGDVVIMPYRIIGEGAIVGAGSVVTRVRRMSRIDKAYYLQNVRPYTIVAGNPAKEMRSLDQHDICAERRMCSVIQQEDDYMIASMEKRRYEEVGAPHPDERNALEMGR